MLRRMGQTDLQASAWPGGSLVCTALATTSAHSQQIGWGRLETVAQPPYPAAQCAMHTVFPARRTVYRVHSAPWRVVCPTGGSADELPVRRGSHPSVHLS